MLIWISLIFIAANSGSQVKLFFKQYTNIPINIANSMSSTGMRFENIYNYNDIDILFIGSSHCYRAFDPRIFKSEGYSSFNMGTTSQTNLNSYFLLRQHLNQLKPKVIIIESYWQVLKSDGLESILDLSMHLPPDEELFEMVAANRTFAGLNSYLLRIFSPVTTENNLLEPSDSYIDGGFVEKDADYFEKPVFDSIHMAVESRQLSYLLKIIDLAQQNNIQIVLVEQPTPKAHQEATLNLDEIRNQLIQIAADNKITFINGNDLVSLDQKIDFFDYHHLHQSGVIKFNKALIIKLRTLNLLPN